jgi:hypothetical protein
MTVGTPSTIIFGPDSQVITDITNANPGVVTTQSVHGFEDGLYVRISMPGNFGMNQVANQFYEITVLSTTTFSIPINTTNFDAFVSNPKQKAQAIPIAEISSTLINREKNNLTPIGGPP